ncbi:unnamed protein product [Camellia sinensis]
MRASRLPQAWRRGQGQGAGGLGWPKKGQSWVWTLVLPNWSRYRRNSRTWAPLQRERESGGRWLRRYCPKVFQSRRFWFSYRLRVVGDDEDDDAEAEAEAEVVMVVVLVMMVVLLFGFKVCISRGFESIERERESAVYWREL